MKNPRQPQSLKPAEHVYQIIDSYKASKIRVFGFGSRPENTEKALKLKEQLSLIIKAVESKEINSLQEFIIVRNILNDRRFLPPTGSQGKFFGVLKSAIKTINDYGKIFISSTDSKESKKTPLKYSNFCNGKLDLGKLSENYEQIPSLIEDFITVGNKIKEYLGQVASGSAQFDTSPLFQFLLDAYGISFPQPNIIFNLSEHLSSAPLPRLTGWRPSTAKRAWDNPRWIQNSYPDLDVENPELALVDKLGPAYKPSMISIKNIKEAVKELKYEAKNCLPSYSILQKSDALVNHNFRCFQNGIVQMASQGNCQESVGRRLSTLSAYCSDHTQGPATAMSAVDATLARRVFLKDCDMMTSWLSKYDPDQKYFDYQAGYMTPKPGQVQECLNLLETHGDEILMNVQQVRIDNASQADNHWMTQVPSFAFALGGYDIYKKNRSADDSKHMSALCEKLLTIQYQALAHLAVLKSQALNQRIPLLLTPVGGGVFENPKKALYKAISSIQNIVEGAKVDVVLSIFSASEVEDFINGIPFLKDKVVLTHEQMSKIEGGNGLFNHYQSVILKAKSSAEPVKEEEVKETPEIKSQAIPETPVAPESQPAPTLAPSDSKLISQAIAKRLYMAVKHFNTPLGNNILALKASEEKVAPNKFPLALTFCEISYIPGSVGFTKPNGYLIKGFQGYIQLANSDLIAIVKKYKLDSAASVTDNDLTHQKQHAADQLIALLKQHDYDTPKGKEVILNKVYQLARHQSLIPITLFGQPPKFKEMLDAFKNQLQLRDQQASLTPASNPTFKFESH